MKVFQAFFAGNQLGLWWKDRRDANQILCGDSGIAKSQFK
jgi:DNA replicative helicase MCM subunit Mcm2 (Cdc46/Mcm family)